MTYILGIDPGLKGAVAIMYPEGNNQVFDIPVMQSGKTKNRNEIDCRTLYLKLEPLSLQTEEVIVYLENVHAMPKNGSQAGFSLGHTVGGIKGVIAALGFTIYLVSPRKWKKFFGLTSDKEMSRATAIRLFPDMAQYLGRKKDSDRAEALLIALYGAETRNDPSY